MEALLLQVLNGLDKGGAYALIALGLTHWCSAPLGVVNFAHGAIFMLGRFVTVSVQNVLTISMRVKDESITFFDATRRHPISRSGGVMSAGPSSITRCQYPFSWRYR